MRLHRLEMVAFGPFAETTVVDFDALGADGLFLLHGQTGAGKTTVLDAIAFAFYGTVPGARRECKRLHSDHAPVDTPPRVTLEATIGGRRARIVRSPEFARPKLRGEGMRKENAKATLTWLDGRGQNLTRINEIGDEVNRLLGMSADQFFQVVLLPQGEFARFLCADNEDRERLLERLFDTERFGDAEQWLAARRKDSAARLADRHQAIDRLSAQVCTAAGVAGPDADITEWAQDLLASARDAKQRTEIDVAERKTASAHAAEELAIARRVIDLHRRMRVAEEQLAAFHAGAQDRENLAAELADARRAIPIGSAIADVESAKTVVIQSYTTMQAAIEDLTSRVGGRELAAVLSWPPAPSDRETIDAAVGNWAAEVGRLDDAVADTATADRLEDEIAELNRERVELDAALADIAIERKQLPGTLLAREDELRRAQVSAASLPGIQAERDKAADAVAAAIEFARHRKALADSISDLDVARTRHLDARTRVLDLREKRLSGMAAELAATLVDGEPCQVCGSQAHPAPARATSAKVTKADEAAAAKAERSAVTAVDAATARVAAIERECDVVILRGGDRDANELATALNDATDRLTAAVEAARRADELTETIELLRSRDAQLADALRSSEKQLGVVVERIAAHSKRVAELRLRVQEATGADTTAAERRARLASLARSATRLRDARIAAAAAQGSLDERLNRLDVLVRENGFDTVACAADAVRTAERQRAIEAELTKANEVRAHAMAVLADPEIVAVRDRQPADVAQLESDYNAAADALGHAIAAHSEAKTRVRQLEDPVAALWAAVDRLAPMQAEHDELEGVAELVAGRGQNSRRMTLRSYVLAARLEEVAAAGTARLRRMSAGRYEFVHSDAAGSRGKRGGLGLDIRDDYTGSIRPAKTLSGGETFTASLALALGLADVVAAESGGLVLDTMFIDEGFGSLDNDALDAVMGVLDELRAGGRVVGIVSHVDEMRQRIPSRLHVIRGRTGSRLEVQVAV